MRFIIVVNLNIVLTRHLCILNNQIRQFYALADRQKFSFRNSCKKFKDTRFLPQDIYTDHVRVIFVKFRLFQISKYLGR